MGELPKLEREGRVDLDDQRGELVRIGSRTYGVVPQKIGRLRAKLGVEFQSLAHIAETLSEENSSLASFLNQGQERAYRLLKVMIPDLMPLHEFMGYSTEAAYEAQEYHEESDVGPDFPQIVEAFEVSMRVNRLDLFGHIKGLVDTSLVKAYINKTLVDMVYPESREDETTTSTSANTSATPGPDTPLTPSLTTPQTPELQANAA